MVERGDNSGVHQYGPAEHFTHITSDKPSPKDKYVAYAINIPDYELAADVYNINVTSPSGQQETFKILINPEHLRQTLERKSLTAVQKSQCEIITPKKPGEAILHAFNATYQQIRKNISEFARCHYGYIQIPLRNHFPRRRTRNSRRRKRLLVSRLSTRRSLYYP